VQQPVASPSANYTRGKPSPSATFGEEPSANPSMGKATRVPKIIHFRKALPNVVLALEEELMLLVDGRRCFLFIIIIFLPRV